MIESIVGSQFPKKVIPLLESATKSIDIIVFDWRWYPNDPGAAVQLFNQAVVRAARRGVQVRAIANFDEIIKILQGLKCQAKRIATKGIVHCKLMIIDDQIVVTGSHNYTQNAFQMNQELSVIIHNPENISEFSNFFNNLWLNYN